MAGLTLDAGALIAVERGNREVASLAIDVVQQRGRVTVPAGVLAQVWRGPQSARIAQLLRSCYVETLDHVLARRIGELCGRAGTSDIVDAWVVLGAAERRDTILTSDPDDIRRLLTYAPGVARVVRV